MFLDLSVGLQDFIVPAASLARKVVTQKYKLVLAWTLFRQTYHCRIRAPLNQGDEVSRYIPHDADLSRHQSLVWFLPFVLQFCPLIYLKVVYL